MNSVEAALQPQDVKVKRGKIFGPHRELICVTSFVPAVHEPGRLAVDFQPRED